MRVLLNENVDRRLRTFFDEFEVATATFSMLSRVMVSYDRYANMEAYKTGKTTREVARERTDFSKEALDELLDVRKTTEVTT